MSAEGERFLAAFADLKQLVEDDPDRLKASGETDVRLCDLCDELSAIVRNFEIAEEWSPFAFTRPVSIASATARREFYERWQEAIRYVASRDFRAILEGLLLDRSYDVSDDQGDEAPLDPLAIEIADWKDFADEDVGKLRHLFDYVEMLRDNDDFGDFEWVHDSLRAWDRLMVSGLDIRGAFWRRRAIPHVLVPAHVASHYGEKRASLYRRLHQAARAFIFGAPLAALALQRAVLEEVLEKHWGAEKGHIREANLPELSWDARADKLKNLANDALHGDPERLSPDQLDRTVIENFLLLRLLIERAPERVPTRNGRRS